MSWERNKVAVLLQGTVLIVVQTLLTPLEDVRVNNSIKNCCSMLYFGGLAKWEKLKI